MRILTSMSWLTAISIMIVLLFLNLFLLFSFQSGGLVDHVQKNTKIIVELEKSISDSLIQTIENELFKKSVIDHESIQFYSEKKALDLMVGELDNLSYIDEDNPFNALFSFTLMKEFWDDASIINLKNELLEFQGVSEVYTQEIDFSGLQQNLKRISNILLGIFGFFTIFSIVLIYNVMKLSLRQDEKLVKTMILVGANEAFILKPYMKKAIVTGMIGFFGCLIISVFLGAILTKFQPDTMSIISTSKTIWSIVIVLKFAVILPLISTYMTIRLYLRKL